MSNAGKRTYRAVTLLSANLGLAALLWWCRPGGLTVSEPDADVVRAAAWTSWLLAGYLVLGCGSAAAAHLPGLLGVLGRVARSLAPQAMVRAVDLAVGAGAAALVLMVPAAASAAPGPMPPRPTSPWSPPSLDWPGAAPASAAEARSRCVVVQPGDTLWGIVARYERGAHPARIAAAWPVWWAANRSEIGPDPDLIKPGQRLCAPAATGHGSIR